MAKQRKNKQNLRGQIMGGYTRVIFCICILGLLTIGFLGALFWNYQTLDQMEQNRLEIQQVIVSHYGWRAQLSSSLQSGEEFSGSLDPTSCSFGKWVQQNISGDQADPQVVELVRQVETPHEEMHQAAADVLQTRERDPEAAIEQFNQEVEPYTDEVIQALGQIDTYYTQQVDQAKATFQALLLVMLLLIVAVTAGIAVFSVWYAKRLADRISKPVVHMAKWANRLALGVVESEADAQFRQMQEENKDNEVGTMMGAFQAMADNIEQNVKVLQRVAQGDMTTFVNIRSHHDSLGKSLYHLVQSNDAVFNEIVEAAHTVAAGAGEIASVSHSLAESATEQATAVHNLSEMVQHASELIQHSDEKAQQANQITEKIKQDTQTSNQHVKLLVDSVMQIQQASQRISAVMKSIDDIAFETNILALNAAIEAARAGTAGKGFAVGADEVRALALKSTEAAEESKTLIQDSIRQAEQGSAIAAESAAIFDAINEGIEQIVEIVGTVSTLSSEQLAGISQVNEEINQIAEAATSNAAISQESDAASHEMSRQADILRQAMQRFNLRKRAQGQAFIPPEKQGDAAFIRAANEAYQHAEQTGHFGNEYIDPEGAQMESALLEK